MPGEQHTRQVFGAVQWTQGQIWDAPQIGDGLRKDQVGKYTGATSRQLQIIVKNWQNVDAKKAAKADVNAIVAALPAPDCAAALVSRTKTR